MTRSRWSGVAAALVAMTAAGCSGAEQPRGTYEATDVARLAEIAPRTPGWPPWPQRPDPKQPPSDAAKEALARDPIYARYRRRTAEIEQRDGWESSDKWTDQDKLANLVVGVLDTSADAHVAFVASNDLARAYGAKYGFVVRAEAVDRLGDEASDAVGRGLAAAVRRVF